MSELRSAFERDLDTRLESEPWGRVYPGQGGMYYSCPVCAAMIPDEVNIISGSGAIAGRHRGQTVQIHIDWHKAMGG